MPRLLAGAAVLAFLLGLDELEQGLDLGGGVTVRFEDLGGVPRAHLGAKDQPVGLVQRVDPLGADAVRFRPTMLMQRTFEGLPSTSMNRGTS